MKHIFILNPAAGKGSATTDLRDEILSCAQGLGLETEIYVTRSVGDARDFVSNYKCAQSCRFYACGGDGTLNEVVSGALEKGNCEVGVVPYGTGNDFVRNFENCEYFSDIESQMRGEAVPVDVIRYNGGCVINVANVGIDCRVVARTAKLKHLPFISGPLAYIAGLVVEFCRRFGDEMEITVDGEKTYSGEYMLCCVANGAFYGGGFNAASLASVRDGLLEFNLIKKISRSKFLSLVGDYKAGRLYTAPNAKGLYEYVRCREVTIKMKRNPLFCVDGELINTEQMTFCVDPGAVRFCIPRGCAVGDESDATKETKAYVTV